MSFLLFLNGRMYHKSFSKFHDPILSIDLGDLEMICEKKNELLFFCEEPRSNIALLVSRIEFYFTFAPDEEAIGQLSSTILINYHVDKNPRNHVYENCVIFTKGYKITEIIIYLPTHEFTFLRELKYHFYEKTVGYCTICFETKSNMVHVDSFHQFCLDCILKTIPKCPLCRQRIA